MSSPSVSSSGGVGFFGLLTIALIVLKLLGKINISWFWALSPVLAGAAITILIFLFAFVVAVLAASK